MPLPQNEPSDDPECGSWTVIECTRYKTTGCQYDLADPDMACRMANSRDPYEVALGHPCRLVEGGAYEPLTRSQIEQVAKSNAERHREALALPADVPLPRERPGTCEYDQRHRELLSEEVRARLPDKCIEPLDGYPTAAAGWLAAVDRELKAVRQRAETPKPAPKVVAAQAEADVPPINDLINHVRGFFAAFTEAPASAEVPLPKERPRQWWLELYQSTAASADAEGGPYKMPPYYPPMMAHPIPDPRFAPYLPQGQSF